MSVLLLQGLKAREQGQGLVVRGQGQELVVRGQGLKIQGKRLLDWSSSRSFLEDWTTPLVPPGLALSAAEFQSIMSQSELRQFKMKPYVVQGTHRPRSPQ